MGRTSPRRVLRPTPALPGDDLGAIVRGRRHGGVHGTECPIVDEWTHRDAVTVAGSEDVARGPLRDRLDQLLIHRGLDEDPAGARAGLPREGERRAGHDVGSSLDVGVGEHDDGVLATELQLQPLAQTGGGVDLVTDCRRTGERDGVDSRVGDEVGAGIEAMDDVEDARWQAGLDEGICEPGAHQRRHRRWLEHHRVPGGERRADLAARQVQREVPRSDHGDDTDRVEHRVHERRVVARERGAEEAVRLAGVQLQVLRCPARLVTSVGEWLALFGDHLGGQVVRAGTRAGAPPPTTHWSAPSATWSATS